MSPSILASATPTLPGGNSGQDNYIEALKRLKLEFGHQKSNVVVMGKVREIKQRPENKDISELEAYILWRYGQKLPSTAPAASADLVGQPQVDLAFNDDDDVVAKKGTSPFSAPVEASTPMGNRGVGSGPAPRVPPPRAPAPSNQPLSAIGSLQVTAPPFSSGPSFNSSSSSVGFSANVRRSPRKHPSSSSTSSFVMETPSKKQKLNEGSSGVGSGSEAYEGATEQDTVMVYRVRLFNSI